VWNCRPASVASRLPWNDTNSTGAGSHSIAPSRAGRLAPLKVKSCRSQALYLFVSCLNFLFKLHHLRVFLAHRRCAAYRAPCRRRVADEGGCRAGRTGRLISQPCGWSRRLGDSFWGLAGEIRSEWIVRTEVRTDSRNPIKPGIKWRGVRRVAPNPSFGLLRCVFFARTGSPLRSKTL
jgi:hypothetical protein